MKINGAEFLIRFLEKNGFETVSGIPGGGNLPIYNAMYGSSIRHILARHEQGAGFISQGMARSTGKTAVCMATSGPGATNLVTAIADAKLDSVPIVAITGQVSSHLLGTDAFQEVDTFSITKSITKKNYLVKDGNDLVDILPEAFASASEKRPGPVLIDITKDAQTQIIDINSVPEIRKKTGGIKTDFESLKRSAALINLSERPVIIAGGGVISSDSSDILKSFAEKNSIPVTMTLMGLSAIPHGHRLNLGMIGMHAKRSTNYILDRADMILVLGARFDDRATGNIKEFCCGAKVIHVDIDPSELNKLKKADIAVNSELGSFLRELDGLIYKNQRQKWRDEINKIRIDTEQDFKRDKNFLPSELLKTVSEHAADDSIIVTDVGQHQMWVAQHYPFLKPRTLLTSGGLGTMGFGLPVSIGAALANSGKTVICFSGDGSFQMNIQELALLAELGLNVKIIILNNGHLGLVRQQQELFYSGNFMACQFSGSMDFVEISRGFGVSAERIPSVASDLNSVIKKFLSSRGPSLLDVKIPHIHKVLPMVPPGAPNTEMIHE